MEATAKVIPWNGKALSKEAPAGVSTATGTDGHSTLEPRFGALSQFVVMIPDEQLEALGAIFSASPLRGAMTFEGYLIAKGYGQLAS